MKKQIVTAKALRGHRHKDYSYNFQEVFDGERTNHQIYHTSLKPLVNQLKTGVNVTYFAYGMTGSGKTHTMMGNVLIQTAREPGLIQLILDDILQEGLEVSVSYFDIYNETVRDLLEDNRKLQIFENPSGGVVVSGLSSIKNIDKHKLQVILEKGNSCRSMAETKANCYSTRSHTIFQVNFRSAEYMAKLYLIDLAGSERAAATENSGKRMEEGAKINKSLLALGNCINVLSNPKNAGKFVPYRDSKLTRILKESLGGNAVTVMLGCVSFSRNSLEETLNTLKYAYNAQNITKKVVPNITYNGKSKYLRQILSLKGEVQELKAQLKVVSLHGQAEGGTLIPENRVSRALHIAALEKLNLHMENTKIRKAVTKAAKQLQEKDQIIGELREKLSMRNRPTDRKTHFIQKSQCGIERPPHHGLRVARFRCKTRSKSSLPSQATISFLESYTPISRQDTILRRPRTSSRKRAQYTRGRFSRPVAFPTKKLPRVSSTQPQLLILR